MIMDGYSRHVMVGRYDVIYRPAPKAERDYCNWLWKRLNDGAAKTQVFDWLRSHVVSLGSNFSLEIIRPEHFEQLFKTIQGVLPDSSGEYWRDAEPRLKKNLEEGIELERTDPRIARRSCDDCKKWWFNEQTGEIIVSNVTGERLERIGPTRCESVEGCPKGTPDKQRSLCKQNRWALRHYLECKATGQFPNDPIVRQNAVIIERALNKVIRK